MSIFRIFLHCLVLRITLPGILLQVFYVEQVGEVFQWQSLQIRGLALVKLLCRAKATSTGLKVFVVSVFSFYFPKYIIICV